MTPLLERGEYYYMSGETVIYKNNLNLIPLRRFTSVEMNLFFTMCNKLKDKGNNEITISFDNLKQLSNYEPTAKARFINDLKHVYDKVLRLTYTEYSGLSFKTFVLFTDYEVNADKEELSISINPKLKSILNEITGDFTKFELQELTGIKSSYSKSMFRLLKQYKHTGYFKIHIEDFKERLCVAKSYRMTDINQKVLKPIIKDLGSIFPNLRINKVKAKKGRKIEWLEFAFTPEKRISSKRQFQMSSMGKSNPAISREKTPKWLIERSYLNNNESEIDPEFEKEKAAFLKQLKKDLDS